jgi:hypothetical protein
MKISISVTYMNNARIQKAKKAALHALAMHDKASNLQLQRNHEILLRDFVSKENLAAYKSGEFNGLTRNMRNRDLGFTDALSGLTVSTIEGQDVNMVKLLAIVTKKGMIHTGHFKTLKCVFRSSYQFKELARYEGKKLTFKNARLAEQEEKASSSKSSSSSPQKFTIMFASFTIKDTRTNKNIKIELTKYGATTISGTSDPSEVRTFFSHTYLPIPGEIVNRGTVTSFKMNDGYTPDIYTISQALAHAKLGNDKVSVTYEGTKKRRKKPEEGIKKKKEIPREILIVHIGKDIQFKLMLNSSSVQIIRYPREEGGNQVALQKVKRMLTLLFRNGFLRKKEAAGPAKALGPLAGLKKNRTRAVTTDPARRPDPPDEFTGTCTPPFDFIQPDKLGLPCCYKISGANPKSVKKKYAKFGIPIPQSVKDALELTNSPASSVNANSKKFVLTMNGPKLLIEGEQAKSMTVQQLLHVARLLHTPGIQDKMQRAEIIEKIVQSKNANVTNNAAIVRNLLRINANRNAKQREKNREARNRQASANAKEAAIIAKEAEDARRFRPGARMAAAAMAASNRNANRNRHLANLNAAERARIASANKRAKNAANRKAERNRFERAILNGPGVNHTAYQGVWKEPVRRRKKTFNANAFPAQTPRQKNNSSPNSDRRSSYSGTTSETKAGPSSVKKVVRKRQKTMATTSNIQRLMVNTQALLPGGGRRNRQGNTKNNAIVINSSPDSETRRRRKLKGKGPKVNSSSSNNV